MPDYAEQAMKDGWYQEGSKWKHAGHPGTIYYNAKQIWDEALPERLKRPLSISDVGKKHQPKDETEALRAAALPKTDEDVKQQGLIGGVTVQDQIEAQKPVAQKRTLKGYKRGRGGVLELKED